MDFFLVFVFFLTIALSAASYFFYPIVIWAIGGLFPFSPRKSDFHPRVSILIAAYNEERYIREKLINTLDLDYPIDQLEIIVGSDGSTDNTANIVTTYKSKGIKLLDFHTNRGKTAVQNDLVSASTGDIIIFTDAASFLPKDAILKLTRNFADDRVGCVAGRMQFLDTDHNITTQSQGIYWKYESTLRILESRLGRLIGVDGPLYAVRREYYVPLDHNIISDLVTPLLVLHQNRKVILEPEALVNEYPTRASRQELTTRRRITLRGLVGVFAYPFLLNPIRHPFLALQIFFHKLLRWSIGLMVIFNLICCLFLSEILLFKVFLFIHFLLLLAALIGFALNKLGHYHRFFTIPYYFYLINTAATLGFLDFIRRKQAISWRPVR